MIKEMILKADFLPVTMIDEQTTKLMFKTEDITSPVYKTDKDGKVIIGEDGEPIVNHYEDTPYCNVLVEYYRGQRTEAAMRKLVADWYDPETDQKILTGFRWNDKPVWLSTESQFNFKAAYDLAIQTNGSNLPITFKLGEDNSIPVYHTFTTIEDLADFYTNAMLYIQQCLSEGWAKKDNFDWSLYTTPNNNE